MTEQGRRTLVGLAIIAVALLLFVAWPFGEAIIMAAVLASAFHPYFERLSTKLGGRRALAASLFVTMVVIAVVLPLAGILLAVVDQADDALKPVRVTFQAKGLAGLIDSLPEPLPVLAKDFIRRLPRGAQQLEEMARGMTGKILGGVGTAFLTTGSILLQISMMLVGFFFLLVDGPAFVRWMLKASPLTTEQMQELLSTFRDVSMAVLIGSFGTALIQTLIALFGFWVVEAPHPLLLAAATFTAAFIPVVGAGSVVVASALFLFFTGHSNAALFLGIWGIGVVSTIDNFVKPLLMRGRLEINTGVTFFALLGGVAAFGPIGLLAGPLIVAFFLAVVKMCQRELSETPVATAEIEETAPSQPR